MLCWERWYRSLARSLAVYEPNNEILKEIKAGRSSVAASDCNCERINALLLAHALAFFFFYLLFLSFGFHNVGRWRAVAALASIDFILYR